MKFPQPITVKDIVNDVLRHRIILTYEAEAEGIDADEIINKILDIIIVP